ncbi:bifunctional diguanylate cyclase/phosphodiesterase [Paenibacillus spiritus]|uniref:Bifunctional diguanylate cyclase/phosphodiesterase n=1 Tax=Paenibacillus spiritus TaxID=2496557 RepID=A0A5J5GJY7_9BACL|nr:EAL domain-containing protein [Paenibacillus spiritus]KAA9008400.1 bifunctional diguanylate cyclase/phosphodiesterase [Paenibacillus spiritus]
MAFFKKKPFLLILAIIFVLQLSLYSYYSVSVDRERRSVQADLSARASMLSANIEERVSIIRGVGSFIRTVGFDADPSLVRLYLQNAYRSTDHVLNIAVAPRGVIDYAYPPDSSAVIMGKSLLSDASLASPDLIRETMNSRGIVMDGPRKLAQGDYGLVMRQAVYTGDAFEGIISVTLRIQDIVDHFLGSNSSLYVTRGASEYLFGPRPKGTEAIISVPVSFYNQQWEIHEPLHPGVRRRALAGVFWIDIALLSLLGFVSYFIRQQTRFSRDLEQLVNARTRDLRASERSYEQMAYYDSLTEIPNRRHFTNTLDALLQSDDPTRRYMLFYFDLNRFKEINDTLGHGAGDQVLKTLAARIQHSGLPYRMFARTGGDEFVMLFEDTPEEAAALAARLSSVVGEPMEVAGARLNLSTSIGVALYPEHAGTRDDLIRFADTAMYQAKTQAGETCYMFDQNLRDKLKQKSVINRHLLSALENRQFVLYYQPQVDIVSGQLVGLEALLRWNHPQEGLIGPNRFIGAVEEAGLMVQLTDWVIREVCRQLAEWKAQGLAVRRTSLNVSNSWFYNRSLIPGLLAVLDEFGLEPDVLEFEITESTAMMEEHYPLLQQIRDIGITVSIDDFGTKYSSLNYLKHFPVNKIKIDRAFITGIGLSPIDEAIIESIAQVASQLGYGLIAEGVETREQADYLVARGCRCIQGYYIARPLPASSIGPMLTPRSSGE